MAKKLVSSTNLIYQLEVQGIYTQEMVC